MRFGAGELAFAVAVERKMVLCPADLEAPRGAGLGAVIFDMSRAVARYVARQWILYEQPVDAEDAVRSIEAVTPDEVAQVARSIPDDFALACVGPHSLDELV